MQPAQPQTSYQPQHTGQVFDPSQQYNPNAAMQVAQPVQTQTQVQAQPVQAAAPVQTLATASGEYPWMAPGERIEAKITGLLDFTSANPIMRIITSMIILFSAILGYSKKATLVVTDQRVAIDVRSKALYFFEKGSDTIHILKASTVTTGYNSFLFIFKKRYIAIDGFLLGADKKFSQIDIDATCAHIKVHL